MSANIALTWTAVDEMCPDCKTLAPAWEQLALDYINEPGVVIGKVDCDDERSKGIKRSEGIKSFPTIKFYPKGSTEAVDYSGGRSEADFISFLNEQTGTHRAPGGGLDSFAGTIPSLDTLIDSLKTGGKQAYEEFGKAAGALQDKYAEYYAKTAKKVEENSDYVHKELTRLQGLLKKGGLAPEKADDLITRSNILNRFVSGSGQAAVKEEL